jgi:peptidoglycan biosynthesis protein MviN/MurJ (putative lipid II flippase)
MYLINLLGYLGLAVSATLGLSLQTLLLGYLTYQRIGTFWTKAWWREIRQIVVATISAGFVACAFVHYNTSPPLLQILLVGAVGSFTYMIVIKLINSHKEVIY